MITKYDQEMLQIMRDPVRWAEHHLGEKPRWYQEQILRHPHHRKVLRCGRRIGKCIEGSQRVMNPETGAYESVETLFQKQKNGERIPLLTLNEEYKHVESEAFFIEDNGVKPCYAVTTKNGNRVVLTGNHPLLTVDGWVEVDGLDPGMSIAIPKQVSYKGNLRYCTEEILLFAYLIGSGEIHQDFVHVKLEEGQMKQEFLQFAQNKGLEVEQLIRRKKSYRILYVREKYPEVYEALKEDRMPAFVFQLEEEQLALFLRGLYDSSGWCYADRIAEIGFVRANRGFLQDLKHLLLRFGIKSNIQRKRTTGTPYYQLMICWGQYLSIFLGRIAQNSHRDYTTIIYKLMEMEPTDEWLPKEIWHHIEQERTQKGLSKRAVVGEKNDRFRPQSGLSKRKAARYAENMESAFLHDLVYGDVLWDEIKSIEAVGERQTYDVFVAETHNLIVEDVCVHNTWTMCAHMLWVAFTCNGGTELKKGATCIVATPYDNQARLIFDQLKTFIENNPILEESVSSMTKNPYVIQFKNKSIIRLFTAGTRSGSEGGLMGPVIL